MRLRRSRCTTPALLGIVLVVLACGTGGTSGQPADPGAIRVVTTTTVFADIVRNIGGSRVSVSSIIPPGVGPEDFEPKPDAVRALADARVIVSNGRGLDDFLDELLTTASASDTPRVVLGEGIPALTVDEEENPHFWLDPTLVKRYYLPAIAARLEEIDPDGADEYQANVKSYGEALDALDAELVAEFASIPEQDRKLVTFHDAFPYFARHYGFELVGVVLENAGQEPTAGELADLVRTVEAAHVRAVFSEAQFNPRLARTLAEEAGVRVVTTLYDDALGPPPADTYLGMMRWNADQITEALG